MALPNQDDELSDLPNYEASSSPVERPHNHESNSDLQPPPATYSIFQKDIVFYLTEYVFMAMYYNVPQACSSLTKDRGPQYEVNKPQPPPLFYVSIHLDNRFTHKSKVAPIRVHYGPSETYPVIGDVRFRKGPTSDITLYLDTANPAMLPGTDSAPNEHPVEITTELTKVGMLTTDCHQFYHILPAENGLQVRERYEWKHSGERDVTMLARENHAGENISRQEHGLKLVRCSDQKSLAVYVGGKYHRVYNPRRVAGKLRFVDQGWAGDGLKLLAVMTILSIMERGRRNAVHAANSMWCTVS